MYRTSKALRRHQAGRCTLDEYGAIEITTKKNIRKRDREKIQSQNPIPADNWPYLK